MTADFERGLAEVLHVLASYSEDLVLVGGWVPSLYARHLGLNTRVPLFTRDIDLAVPRSFATRGRTVDELLKEAGLEDRFKSRLKPPAVSYVGTLGGSEVEVEFLTNEPGNREGPRVVQPGLHAVGLHYIDLLMESAFPIDVEVGSQPVTVLVPSPTSYIVQKSLVFPQRPKREKQAKDLYNVFDVWEGCRSWREWIAAEATGLRERRGSWATRALDNLDMSCGIQDGEGVAMIVEQRPATAFPDLDAEQFGQYVWGEMAELREVLRG